MTFIYYIKRNALSALMSAASLILVYSMASYFGWTAPLSLSSLSLMFITYFVFNLLVISAAKWNRRRKKS